MPKSVMPPYRYLFERRTVPAGQPPSIDALPLGDSLPADEEVVPRDEARQLAAYLLSLRSDAVLFETPPPPTNSAPAKAGTATNNALPPAVK